MIPGMMVQSHTFIRFSPAIIAYRIPGMLGGIKMPRKPQALIRPVEYSLEYPAFSISGSIIPPIPVMVAREEPVIAPNSIQVTIVTAPTAPLSLPMMELANLITAEEIPDAAIRSPAKINAGIARNVNTFSARNAPIEIATLVPPTDM